MKQLPTYAILAFLLPISGFAESFEIIYPDKEIKSFVFNEDITKKIGGWSCEFFKGQDDKQRYLFWASCSKGSDSVATGSICNKNYETGQEAVLRINGKTGTHAIILKCNSE